MTMKGLKMFKNKINSIKDSFHYWIIDFLSMRSTRIQLVFGTFFAWLFSMFHFGFLIPLFREISIIFYRQNSINAKQVDFDSPHAATILGMTGAAFLSVVAGYIGSTYLDRKNSATNARAVTMNDSNNSAKVETNRQDNDSIK